MPGLMILSATLRRTGSVCSAMQTAPMPPSPICSQQLVGADHACRAARAGRRRRLRRRPGSSSEPLQEAARLLVGPQQAPRPAPAGPRRRRRPRPGRPRRSSGRSLLERGRGRSSSAFMASIPGQGDSPSTLPMRAPQRRGIHVAERNPRTASRRVTRRRSSRRVEPGPGVGPVPVGRAAGDPERRRPPPRPSARRSSGA